MFALPTSHISSRILSLIFRNDTNRNRIKLKSTDLVSIHVGLLLINITQINCQDYTCSQLDGQASTYLQKTLDFIASDNAETIYDCSVNFVYSVDNTIHDNSLSCSGPWMRSRGILFLFFCQDKNSVINLVNTECSCDESSSSSHISLSSSSFLSSSEPSSSNVSSSLPGSSSPQSMSSSLISSSISSSESIHSSLPSTGEQLSFFESN